QTSSFYFLNESDGGASGFPLTADVKHGLKSLSSLVSQKTLPSFVLFDVG
ncbi:hypothetical protein LINPERHAP1_LOCUS24409, partial [Linum perenne]